MGMTVVLFFPIIIHNYYLTCLMNIMNFIFPGSFLMDMK